MTTLTAFGLPVAYSWNISIGSGWIALMLIGMALCFVCMLGFMWLIREGRGWPMCGQRWEQTPTSGESGRSSR